MAIVEVKRVGVGSVFALVAAIFMIAGLILGLFAYRQIAELYPFLTNALETRGVLAGAAISILFSFVCGIAGGLLYTVLAVIYNLFAALIGGIKVEIYEE